MSQAQHPYTIDIDQHCHIIKVARQLHLQQLPKAVAL
jgi:hypothetical protein